MVATDFMINFVLFRRSWKLNSLFEFAQQVAPSLSQDRNLLEFGLHVIVQHFVLSLADPLRQAFENHLLVLVVWEHLNSMQVEAIYG